MFSQCFCSPFLLLLLLFLFKYLEYFHFCVSALKIIFIMLIHITVSNAFVPLSYGTRDIIFNMHALDFIWAVAVGAAAYFSLHILLYYFRNFSKATKRLAKAFFTFPFFFGWQKSLWYFFIFSCLSSWFRVRCVPPVSVPFWSPHNSFAISFANRDAAQDKLYAKYDWVYLDMIVYLYSRI